METKTINVRESAANPADLLAMVADVDEIILAEGDSPVARLTLIETVAQRRPFGLAAGDFVVPDDFDAPLPEDLLKAFEGR